MAGTRLAPAGVQQAGRLAGTRLAPAGVQQASRLAGISRLTQPPVTARRLEPSQGQPVPSHPPHAPATPPQPVASPVISTGDHMLTNCKYSIVLKQHFQLTTLVQPSIYFPEREESYTPKILNSFFFPREERGCEEKNSPQCILRH